MAYCRYPSEGGGGGGSGTVTSVNVSGSTSGLTFSGGPITTSGTISLSGGTLVIARGGTNSNTALNNNRVMQSSGGAIVEAAAITASRALTSDANGIPVASATTATELGYVNGVTSAIQTQLNAKQASGNYITALTGDVTASGPGSASATLASNFKLGSFGITIDGGGSAITTGWKGIVVVPYACTITGWEIFSCDANGTPLSGSIVVDVLSSSYSGYPTLSSIAGSEKPTLSTANKNQDLSLSTWTTSVSAGAVMGFNVDSASTVTRVFVTIFTTKT